MRGFPVPRMHVEEIEAEFSFAIANDLDLPSLYANSAVKKNIILRCVDFVAAMPNDADFSPILKELDVKESNWTTMVSRLNEALEGPFDRQSVDRASLINDLTLTIENEILDVAGLISSAIHSVSELMEKRNSPFRKLRPQIEDKVGAIVLSMDSVEAHAEAIDQFLDLKVLIAAAALEGMRPEQVQTVKLKIRSADRKWVMTTKDGVDVPVLDQHR
jgi:hypothetical protein